MALDFEFECFPTCLFICDDDITPMHFVLSLENNSEQRIRKIVELMQHCGADVSLNLAKASAHSIVIVDHDDVLSFHGPAFTLEYVTDCLEDLKLKDISEYRQEATKNMVKNEYCMDVVYFRTKTWYSRRSCLCFRTLSSDSESKKDAENQTSSKTKENFRTLSSDSESEKDEENQTSSKTKENFRTLSSDSESEKDAENQTSSKTKEKTLSIDSESETDEENHTSRKTKEKTLSIDSESKKDEEYHTSRKTKENFRALFNDPESEKDEENRTSSKTKEKLPLNDSDSEIGEDTSEPNKSPKMALLNDQSNEGCPKPTSSKHSKKLYTSEERVNILKYIIARNEHGRVKGREMWTLMERRKVCPGRTWQSMKEHFLKKIVFELETYVFLTEEDKRKIKRVCF